MLLLQPKIRTNSCQCEIQTSPDLRPGHYLQALDLSSLNPSRMATTSGKAFDWLDAATASMMSLFYKAAASVPWKRRDDLSSNLSSITAAAHAREALSGQQRLETTKVHVDQVLKSTPKTQSGSNDLIAN